MIKQTPKRSRREVLNRLATIVTLPLFGVRCHGQTSADTPGTVPPPVPGDSAKLVYEFANAVLLAISPNEKAICLYFTHHPQDSFALRGRQWTTERDKDTRSETLQVVALRSWKAQYSVRMKQKTYRASFFADSDHIYAETLPFVASGQSMTEQILVDLQSGKREEHLRLERKNEAGVYYAALEGRILLSTEFSRSPTRYTFLDRSIWPDSKETARTPFRVTPQSDAFGHDTEVCISADRNTFVYSTDQYIVCRRTSDLAIQWKREIEPGYFGAVRLAISSDGKWVAAAIVDTTFVEQQRKYYIEVFNGKDGAPISRLSLKGDAGIAISPDGKWLAIGERVEARQVQLAVSIVDVKSGRRVVRIIHDQFYIEPGEEVNSYFGMQGIQFASNGKLLITSSVHTKIWELNLPIAK